MHNYCIHTHTQKHILLFTITSITVYLQFQTRNHHENKNKLGMTVFYVKKNVCYAILTNLFTKIICHAVDSIKYRELNPAGP